MQQGIQQGAASEARRLVVLLGQEKFGHPTESVDTAIAAITDTLRLEDLAKRVIHASSWDELLKSN
jgi:hypothetical protein